MTEHLEAGLFAVDADARTVRGLLTPYNERSRAASAAGVKTPPVVFRRGDLGIPADPDIVGLNVMHDRFDPRGRASELEDTDRGVLAMFRIAKTPKGDAWLADHGDLVRLSPEIANLRIRPDGTATGDLVGAALVDEGAFASAGLFAIDDAIQDAPETPADDEAEIVVGGDNPTDPAPAEPDDEPVTEPDDTEDEEEDAVNEAAPTTMLARRGTPATPATPKLSKHGLFAALRQAIRTADPEALKPYIEDAERAGLFALNDVKYDGTGGLVNGAGIPNQWLGELWQGRQFQRRIVPLIAQGTLQSTTAIGWTWNTKPTMATWAGNKANVPSNAPATAPASFTAQRFAGGHDLAREFYDFNVTEVIDSYVQAMVDSYARLSDAYALAQLTAGAAAFTPSATATTDNKELLTVIDGALAVVAAQATPSFALVAPDVFRGIIGTPHSDALEYFNASIGLEDGSSAGFRIIPDASLPTGQVIVGAREAATAWELPGVPIRVSAPDLVKGGIDNAFFGYIAVGVTYDDALVKAVVPTAAP